MENPFRINMKSTFLNLVIISITLIMIPIIASAKDSATIRPIEDFVYAQGTYCIPDGGGGCFLFVPPLENFMGFNDPVAGLSASVDYAGIADDYLEGMLGTEFDGTVIERPLADGRANVRVILHTSNALAWVVEGFDFNGDPLVFGYRVPEVEAGARPGLADSVMECVFINSAPGAPLPDLLELFIEHFEDLKFFTMKASATGLLRGEDEGAAGMVKVIETGLFMTPFMGAVSDGFPVEKIKVKKIGK